ncbi:MAG: TRM11 family SAM-dependent methyltransferase, partial [Pseudonocardiaceae bacterium]
RDIPLLAANLARHPVPAPLRRARTFRTRIAESGQLVKVNDQVARSLELSVAAWCGLQADRRGGDVELWVTHRRGEERVSLAVRLDRARSQVTPKGALRPEVAAALVRVVPPRSEDVVLDPFAGSGAIPVERARYPYRQLIAADIDPASVRSLKALARRGALGLRPHVERVDVADIIRGLLYAKVDRVITDPPWGIFRADADLTGLYRSMWATIDALLAPNGLAVVLTAATEEARMALSGTDLVEKATLPVLINGKKATVLAIARPSAPWSLSSLGP